MTRVAKSVAVWGLAVCCMTGGARLVADQAESLESLRAAKLKVAQQWWDVLMERFKVGSMDLSGADEFRAAQALKDADLEVAKTKQQRIKTLAAYRDHMQAIFDRFEAAAKAGTPNAGSDRVFEAQIHLLEAKIWLKEEEAKP